MTALVIAEAVTMAGAAIGFRLHGYRLVSILWLLPGLASLLWAFERFERWRGRKVPLLLDRLVIALFLIAGIAVGDWLQEIAR